MATKNIQKRRVYNYLIRPAFQIRYSLYMVTGAALLASLYAFVYYVYIEENYHVLVEIAQISESARLQLLRELDEIMLFLILATSAFLILVFFFGIYLSHRVAGPMYKMKKRFEEIELGSENQKIVFRDTDEFQDVADKFNSMMESVKTKL